MSTKSLNGSCACGTSTYTYSHTSPPQHLDFCYCLPCQRISGAPFIAFMGLSRAGLSFSGPITTIRLSSVAERTFCSKCGGTLTMQYDCYPEKTHLAAATVRESQWEVPKVGVHIFVKSCPKWYVIPDDGVERFEEFDSEFERMFPDVVKRLRESA